MVTRTEKKRQKLFKFIQSLPPKFQLHFILKLKNQQS